MIIHKRVKIFRRSIVTIGNNQASVTLTPRMAIVYARGAEDALLSRGAEIDIVITDTVDTVPTF